ncbi:MAG TPA: AsmA family protein, partial [Bryobacteraceae bacterium]|nr:AsmA family protein [Bryobacteraceae bacterium]
MKKLIRWSVVVLAVLVVLVLAIPAFVNANQFRPRLETALSTALSRPVALGDIGFSLYSGSLRASDLSIGEDARFGNGPFVRAKSLKLGVELWPLLFSRRLNVTDLTITEPELRLAQNASGEWNFSSIGGKAAPAGGAPAGPAGNSGAAPAGTGAPIPLAVRLISIEKGRLTLARLGGNERPTVLDNVNVTVKDFSAASKFPFTFTGKLGKGDISLSGEAGPINAADASQTPVSVQLKITGVDLADTGITASSGISGLLSISGTGSLAGNTLAWRGVVHVDQAKFVPHGTPAKQAVEFDSAVQHDLKNHAGAISQGDIRLGDAKVSLTGTYAETGAVTTVNMHLAGTAMPVNSLAGMLPALDIQLPSGSKLEGGTAAVDATITGPANNPVVVGTVGVNSTKLTGFDLGAKVSTIERIAGIQPSRDTAIQTLSAGVRSDPNGTAIHDLRFIAPAIGELDGAGTISPQHALDFKMSMTLQAPGVMSAAIGRNTAIPFFVQGTSAN